MPIFAHRNLKLIGGVTISEEYPKFFVSIAAGGGETGGQRRVWARVGAVQMRWSETQFPALPAPAAVTEEFVSVDSFQGLLRVLKASVFRAYSFGVRPIRSEKCANVPGTQMRPLASET